MWGRAKAAALLALVTVLLVPAGAQASVTIGSNLGRLPDQGFGCAPPCTVAPASLADTAALPGGLVSPANGTVVLWRIRVGSAAGSTAFRVIRPLGGGLSTGAGTSAMVTPPLNTTTPYPTGLPIAIGDRIGVELGASASRFFVNSTGTIDVWAPSLADGGPGQTTFSSSPQEIAINADIEPTSAFTISNIKPGKGGKLTVTTNLPNPGVVAGGDVRDASVATAASGKKKPKYLKRASLPAAVGNQTIRLLLKPTKAARSFLAEKGKLKTKAKVVFTPTGGSSSTQIIKVKLKR